MTAVVGEHACCPCRARRAKLTAQAKFVVWWDTQATKAPEGRPRKTPDRSVRVLTLGRDGRPDPKVVSRWRQTLNDPARFETTSAAAVTGRIRAKARQYLLAGGAIFAEPSGSGDRDEHVGNVRNDLDPVLSQCSAEPTDHAARS
jgi:hypothetical protein